MTRQTAARSASVLLLVGLTAMGCQMRGRSGSTGRERPVEGAVGSAMRRVTQALPGHEPPSLNLDERGAPGRSVATPSVVVRGAGSTATLEVRSDDAHQDPSACRTAQGWAVLWTDREHGRVYLSNVDARGRFQGTPALLREAVSTEEDLWSPTAAFNGSEFGVVWADPANERLRFARVGANGSMVGSPTIVHEGLSMPVGTRVVWNGSEYGVAVAMHEGVYFTRVDRSGHRIGRGVVLAEGATVSSLETLESNDEGFSLRWREEGAHGARNVRLSREGRPLDATGARFVDPPVRLASR